MCPGHLSRDAALQLPLSVLTGHCRCPLEGSQLPGWGTGTKLSQPSGQQQQKDQSKVTAAALLKLPCPFQAEEHLTLPHKMVQSGKATGHVWDLLLGPPGVSHTNLQYLGASHMASALTTGLLTKGLCSLVITCPLATTAAVMMHCRLKTPWKTGTSQLKQALLY